MKENYSYLIKYASRGRAEWFKKAVNNITETIHTKDYLILVSADEDDEQMNCDNIKWFCGLNEHIKLVYGKSDSKIHAINRDMEQSGDWDVLVCMSDDMTFNEYGWDNVIRNKMNQCFPDGDCFLHFSDGYVKDALATMSIMDRKYYERDGYVYHPSYKSFSSDAEAYYVAMMRERHMYFPEVLANHQHPTNTKIGNDALYKANSLHTEHDTETYFERLRNYFHEPTGHDILNSRPELKPYL